VGEDFSDTLLQGMADAGGGHFYSIERPEQITDLIASEVGELVRDRRPRRRDRAHLARRQTIRPLGPYRFEQRGSRSVLLLGDLVAEQHLEAVVRIKFGYGEIGTEIGVLVGATDRDGALAGSAPSRSAGSTPTSGPTMPSPATARSTELSPPSSPPGPARRPSS